jgi:hypothetical protein
MDLIPGLSTLYEIFRRNIDRDNDVLSERKQLAAELHSNCKQWTALLIDNFTTAVQRWKIEGQQAALDEVHQQMRDFMRVDYASVRGDSKLLEFLREDKRFEPFANSCARFYDAAIHLKRLVYGDIERNGERFTAESIGMTAMVEKWMGMLEEMMEDVTENYHGVKTVKPH